MAKEEKQQTSDEIIIRKIFILRSEKVILDLHCRCDARERMCKGNGGGERGK